MKKFIISSIAAMVVFAGAYSASAATAEDMGTMTIKAGVPQAYVLGLQKNLNMCANATPALVADGLYGAKTTAAVKAFQMSTPGLTVDGKAGNMTKAALVAKCSGTTVSTSTSTVPGCAAGAMFSSTTGAACTVTSWGTSSAEGYISDISADSSNRVSTVYESESDKVVAGVRATAKLSDQKVERIKVTLKQVNGTASVNLGKYISSVSLWNGSTKMATMSVADADRSNTDDTYTFNFTGLNGVITKDQIGRFYVSVNANGSLDSVDAQYASVTVKIEEIRATSPNGVYASNGSAGSPLVTQTGLTFGKFSSNGVKAEVALATSNPTAKTVVVSETSNTNNVTLLNFKITAKNTNLTLRRLPITITMTNASTTTLGDVINSVKLMRGNDQIDNLDGSAASVISTGVGSFKFINLSTSGNTISAGSSAEYSVVVDLKRQTVGSTAQYAAGTTLTAEFTDLGTTNFSVQDSNGDQLQSGSTYRSGSAVGSTMTLRTKGVTATAGSTSGVVTTIGNSTSQQVAFSFPLTLTGSGVDYYVPKAAHFVSSTTMPTATASKGIYFTVLKGSTPISTLADAASIVDSSATVYGTSPEQLLANSTGTNAVLKATVAGDGTASYYKLVILGFAGAETLNGSLATFAVDNQSAYTVTSNGTVQ